MTEKRRAGRDGARATACSSHGPNALGAARCRLSPTERSDGRVGRRKRYPLPTGVDELRCCAGRPRLAERLALLPQVRRATARGAAAVRAPARARRRWSPRRGRRSSGAARAASARPRRSSSPPACRSRRPCSRCAAASWPRTTAPSTSRSARYEHGERAREGARALRLAPGRPAARDDGARQRRSPRGRRAQSGSPRAAAPPSARSPPRPRSSPGWPATRAPARAGARGPGHELQHRFATAEPTPEQLEVAQAALARLPRARSMASRDLD